MKKELLRKQLKEQLFPQTINYQTSLTQMNKQKYCFQSIQIKTSFGCDSADNGEQIQQKQNFTSNSEIEQKQKIQMLKAQKIACQMDNIQIQMKRTDSQVFESKYEMFETIGQGAHAVVKKALKKSDPINFYAIKICRQGDPEIILTFINTYKNARLLQHKYILQVYEIFIDEKTETLYLVMEYSHLQSLEQQMMEFTGKEYLIKGILQKILEATKFMHKFGIAHRDLKPDNILLDYEDLKIIDFGVSKRFLFFQKEQWQIKFRDMWTRTGNYFYCAPEIFSGGGYNEKVDIWSIGIIFYQMLFQRLPFQKEGVYETIQNILEYNDDLKIDQNRYSNMTIDLLRRMLKVNPKNRLSAEDCLNHPFFINSPHRNNRIQSMKRMRLGVKNLGNNRIIRKMKRSITLKNYATNDFENEDKIEKEVNPKESPIVQYQISQREIQKDIHIIKKSEHEQKLRFLRAKTSIFTPFRTQKNI